MSKNSIFNTVLVKKPSTSFFDKTHDVKLSGNMGQLIPICCEFAMPKDKWHISNETLIRFQPLVAPVMHRMDVTIHYFFVPMRLLWNNFEKWITNTPLDAAGDPLPTFPYLNVAAANYTALMDYLGIPTPIGAETEKVSALPFAAYQKICSEYYMDENLLKSKIKLVHILNDGDQVSETWLTPLQNRAWEHDYFTSCLPFAQKGTAVDIPLGEVVLDPTNWLTEGTPIFRDTAGNPAGGGTIEAEVGPDDIAITGQPGLPIAYDPDGTLNVEPTTINDLRVAYRIQEWLEKMARGGTRMIEVIKSHFDVKSSDARLQRPEYITGTKSPITISEVLNTTGDAGTGLPQGNMAGHAISVANSHKKGYFCEEWGFIMGIMSVMPKTAYMQGLDRSIWGNIDNPTEFPWPTFAHLGEQEVKNKEVYAFQAGGAGEDTFGYLPRYTEYKYSQNRVAGDFRSTLDFWHLGRKFASPPALNETFITSDPTHRVFAVTDPTEQKILAQVINKLKVSRALPKFGTPTF